MRKLRLSNLSRVMANRVQISLSAILVFLHLPLSTAAILPPLLSPSPLEIVTLITVSNRWKPGTQVWGTAERKGGLALSPQIPFLTMQKFLNCRSSTFAAQAVFLPFLRHLGMDGLGCLTVRLSHGVVNALQCALMSRKLVMLWPLWELYICNWERQDKEVAFCVQAARHVVVRTRN